MINSIHIQSYKSLHNVMLELTPIHVLIGKNDSGKTSILQALSALCRSVDLELNAAFIGRWSGAELVWKHRFIHSVVFNARVSDGLFNAEYQIECGFREKGKNAFIVHEVIHHGGKKHELVPESSTESAVRRYVRNPSEEVNAPDEVVKGVHICLSGVRTCLWIPSMLSLPVAYEGETDKFDIWTSGFGLPLLLDDILGNDVTKYLELVQRYQVFFPQVRSLKLARADAYKMPPDDGEGVPKLRDGKGKGILFDFANGIEDVPASQVSDGMLIILAYLAILYTPHPPRMLLVEEPENGIHPERLEEIISLLREIVARHPKTQIVLTTHSPYLVSYFSPDEVTLCHKEPDGSVSLHRLSDSSSVQKQKSIFTLGEIWTGEGDDDLAKSTSAAEATSP